MRPPKRRWGPLILFLFLVLSLGAVLDSLFGAVSRGAGSASGGEPVSSGSDLDISFKYISVGWIDWATVQLKEVSENRPEAVDAHLVLGMVYEAAGNREAALAAYERAARAGRGTKEGEGAAMALAGDLLLESGRTREAKEALERALRVSPDSAMILYDLGVAAEREGDRSSALAWYLDAAEASPEWIEPVVKAARIMNGRGAYDEAGAILVESMALGSRHPEFHLQLGLTYLGLLESVQSGSPSEAQLEVLEKLGVSAESALETLPDLIRHEADRLEQLDPQHPGAARIRSGLRGL